MNCRPRCRSCRASRRSGTTALGEVLLDISLDPAPPVADIEDRLREEAGKMGAHAIYVVRDVARPGEARKLIGIAIRYK